MPQETERIGPTAHYTAYVWHRVGLPHAEHFATWKGAVLYWGFFVLGEWITRLLPAVPSMREYLEYRHRLIDGAVGALGPDCIVELGAGLTRRAVTWAADHAVTSVELDLPAMAEVKRQRVAQAPAALRERLQGLHTVDGVDVLAPDFSSTLSGYIAGYERPVVVVEGLLSYLDPPSRQGLLAAVAQAFQDVGGGVMVCNLHTVTAQARVGRATHVLRAFIRALTRRRRALDPFADVQALQGAFAHAGFDSCEEVHPESHVGTEPRLARLRSPAHVIVAGVGPSWVLSSSQQPKTMTIRESELRERLTSHDDGVIEAALHEHFEPIPHATSLTYRWGLRSGVSIEPDDARPDDARPDNDPWFEGLKQRVIDLANAAQRVLRARRFQRQRKENPHWPVVVAEGDSWVAHPLVDDIADHLLDDERFGYAVLGVGAADDLLRTIEVERDHERASGRA